MFQRADGKVACVYWWRTNERWEKHMAASIFEVVPGAGPRPEHRDSRKNVRESRQNQIQPITATQLP